jgi:O-antigen/teichoic acid export membrane protein
MAGLLIFKFSRPEPGAFTRLVSLALRFWLFAVLANLILMVEYLVISQILPSGEIVLYSIMMKIATVGITLFTTVISVMWPEWTHEWELGQWAMLRRRVLTLATVGVLLCVPGAAVAVFAVPIIIRLWLHDTTVVPSVLLILLFVVYLAVRMWTDTHSAALMAGSRITVATKFAMIQALITAPLEYLFGRHWGAEGVIFGLVAGFLASAAWMFPHRFYSELASATRAPASASGSNIHARNGR